MKVLIEVTIAGADERNIGQVAQQICDLSNQRGPISVPNMNGVQMINFAVVTKPARKSWWKIWG